MKTQAHRAPQDRLAERWSKFTPFLSGRGMDMSGYAQRLQSAGVPALVEEFVAECEAKGVMLPADYWRALFRLKKEAGR